MIKIVILQPFIQEIIAIHFICIKNRVGKVGKTPIREKRLIVLLVVGVFLNQVGVLEIDGLHKIKGVHEVSEFI
jgi:hypothetical protein